MKNYIIYAWDGNSLVIEPYFVASKNIEEALQILCASKRSKKKFVTEDSLNEYELKMMKLNSSYKYVDSTELGGCRGFLFIEKLIIKERTGGIS